MPPPTAISDSSSFLKGMSKALWSPFKEGDFFFFKWQPFERFSQPQATQKEVLLVKVQQKTAAYLSNWAEHMLWNFFFQHPVLQVRVPSFKRPRWVRILSSPRETWNFPLPLPCFGLAPLRAPDPGAFVGEARVVLDRGARSLYLDRAKLQGDFPWGTGVSSTHMLEPRRLQVLPHGTCLGLQTQAKL